MTNRFATIVFDGLILSLVLCVFPVYAWATPVSCQGLVRVTPSLSGTTASSCGPSPKNPPLGPSERGIVVLPPAGPLGAGTTTFGNYSLGTNITSGDMLLLTDPEVHTAQLDSGEGDVVISVLWTGSTSDVSYAVLIYVPNESIPDNWDVLYIDNNSKLTLKQLQSNTELAQLASQAVHLINTLNLGGDLGSVGGGGGGGGGSGNGGIDVPDPEAPVAILECGYIGGKFQGCVVVPVPTQND